MTKFYATANGVRATAADVFLPYYGAPVADVTLATADTLKSPVTLQIGNLSLVMALVSSGAFAGVTTARLVGGKGGWGKAIAAAAYANPAGILLSMVLRDAAMAVGETVKLAQDRTLGQFFVREAAMAGRLLRQLAGTLWWMDVAGVTQVAASRTATPITSQATVEHYEGGRSIATIATEDPASWMPGATYAGPTLPGGISISATRFTTDNDGVMRLKVLTQ